MAPFLFFSLNRLVRFGAMGMFPFFIAKIIEEIEAGKLQTAPEDVWFWFYVPIVVFTISYFLMLISYYDSLLRDRVSRSMTYQTMSHMLTLPINWFEREGSGGRMQKIMSARNALKTIADMYTHNLLPFLADVCAMVISIYFLSVSPFYFLLFFGFITSYLGIAILFQRKLAQKYLIHNKALENLSAKVYDFIASVRTIKSFSLTPFILKKSHKHEEEGYNLISDAFVTGYTLWFINNFVGFAWVMAILAFSIQDVSTGAMSLGAMAALFAFTQRIWGWIEYFVVLLSGFTESCTSFIRLREIMGEQPDDSDHLPAVPMPQNWKNLELENLSFNYEGTSNIINNIDMTIGNGQKVALVGPSGAGKSTLIKLIMKMASPTKGHYKIDGQDVANIPRDDLLSTMSLVPQDVELFNGTIRENILIGQEDYDESLYQDCLNKAYLTEFLSELKHGDNTEIGERGLKLSGGQRQRLGIARALARNADIIIFDEASSALDSESESFIQKAVEQAFADKTMIIIAHRLSTIRFADCIYVMDKGTIAEQGSFEKLEKDSTIFKRLWSMQSGGFLND